MKILVVHPRMNIKGGGEQVAIYSMLASLKMGHDVSLLSEEFDTTQVENFYGCPGIFETIDHLSFPPFHPAFGRGLLLYQRLYYYQRQFRRLLRDQFGFDLFLGTQDVGYTPQTKLPIVQYCHFPEYFRHLELNSGSALWRLYYGPARTFYRNRAHVISEFLSNSMYTQSFVKRTWNRDSSVLYPPCRIELYHPSSKEENSIATVGRIVPEKRIELFLEIARRLPTFKFTTIGSVANKEYFDSLREGAPANVSFVVSSERKSTEILAKTRVYVHCMENEHFGIAIVEAMAAGCVPVVHDSGGPREIVTPGIGYKWGTVDEAVGQIANLMQNDLLRQEMSRAAEDRSKAFSTERFEAGLSKVLKNYERADRDHSRMEPIGGKFVEVNASEA